MKTFKEIAKVTNNNQGGWENIIETAPHVTLEIGKKLYVADGDLEDHPMFDAFIRAFWRRIEPYKNQYGKELPKEMPVEFSANMMTALMTFDLK